MSTPSTTDSRNMRVQRPTLIERMVIHGQPVIILNPTLCVPEKKYRLELDEPSGTGWIREEEDS